MIVSPKVECNLCCCLLTTILWKLCYMHNITYYTVCPSSLLNKSISVDWGGVAGLPGLFVAMPMMFCEQGTMHDFNCWPRSSVHETRLACCCDSCRKILQKFRLIFYSLVLMPDIVCRVLLWAGSWKIQSQTNQNNSTCPLQHHRSVSYLDVPRDSSFVPCCTALMEFTLSFHCMGPNRLSLPPCLNTNLEKPDILREFSELGKLILCNLGQKL